MSVTPSGSATLAYAAAGALGSQLQLLDHGLLGLTLPGHLGGVGGGQLGELLLLGLGLEGQGIGSVLLLEAPAAESAQGGQDRQGGGGQQAPGGTLALGAAAALGLPAEVFGQCGQFRSRFGSGGCQLSAKAAKAQEIAELGPQLDVLDGFKAPGGIRPGRHGRLQRD